MPLPLLVWGGIVVASIVTAKLAHDVAKEASAPTDSGPDPKELREKRERDVRRNSFKRDRSSILIGLNEQYDLGINQEAIDKLPPTGTQHRELLQRAIERKAEHILRLPKKERETLEAMNYLFGQIQHTQSKIEARLLEIDGQVCDE